MSYCHIMKLSFPFSVTMVGVGFLSCAIFSCTKEKQNTELKISDTVRAEMIDQGNKASAALFGELVPKLQAAMKSGGPEKAITVCKEVAQTTTLNTSNTFADLKLTRVSLKPRNPINGADEMDRDVLREWQSQLAAGKPFPEAVVKLKNSKTAVYYKPIPIAEVCLKCHGDPSTFPKELTQQLKQLYPDDQAIGYKLNDLRGAFRAEFSLKVK